MTDISTPAGPPRPFAPGPAGLAVGYVTLALAPLAAAWIAVPDGMDVLSELGTGLAFAGYAMLLAQFFITGRFRTVSGRVGVDTVMRLHTLMARAVMIFLVLHPFLYGAGRLATDPGAYLRQVWATFTAAPFLSGVVAWVLLLVLMALAVHRARLPVGYEAWRASHAVGALVIAGAGLHHALTVGQISPEPPVAALWWALFALAVASLVHVYVLRPLGLLRRPFRVAEVRELGPGRWLLALDAERGLFPYRAGQFAWLKVRRHPFGIHENPFSILSAPGQGVPGRAEFLIREAGDFTRTLRDIPVGARAWLDGPYGAFTLAPGPASETVLLLAGGVGLAPILSILRAAAASRDPRRFRLIYGNRTAEQVVMRREIETLRGVLDLAVDFVVSEPPPGWDGRVGRLDSETLGPLLADAIDPAQVRAYLCGPPPMVTAASRALRALGVPPGRVVSERFDYD